jgi:uncharacterized protein YecE (DUF72 family)
MAAPTLRIGTSGWVYRHWMDIFYPAKLPGSQQLPFYAERYDTVEVNFSFYRLPERAVFETWRAQSPEGFLFAVKGSRYITHMKKLKDPHEPLARLLDRAGGLGDRLGPILFQLPPNWPVDVGRLAAFMEALQPYAPQRFAFEFRHASWLCPRVYALLEAAGAALCLPVSPSVPLDVRLTAPWTYVRMHGGRQGVGFGDDELAEWAERIRGFQRVDAGAYVYFNNDPAGHALRDAARLRTMLGHGP